MIVLNQKNLFSILFLIICSVQIISQDLYFKNFTIKNGLPSNTVYSVKQDSKGFLWIATDKGVIRYDSWKFKLYTTSDGLASNDNFSMHIDSKDNVWLYSFKAISKIESSGRIKIIAETKNYFHNFLIDKKDNLYFLSYVPGKNYNLNSAYEHFLIQNNDIFNIGTTNSNDYNHNFTGVTYLKNDTFFLSSFNQNLGVFLTTKSINTLNKSFIQAAEQNKNIFLKENTINYDMVQIDSSTSLLLGKKNFKIINNDVTHTQKKYPFNLLKNTRENYCRKANMVYIPFAEGIFQARMQDAQNLIWQPFILRKNVSNINFDKEENIWVSTLGEGLFKYSNEIIKKIYINSGNNEQVFVTKISGQKHNRIMLLGSDKNIYNLKDGVSFNTNTLKDVRVLIINGKNIIFGGSSALYKDEVLINSQPIKALSIFKDSMAIATSFGINFVTFLHPKIPTAPSSVQITDIRGRFYSVLLLSNLFYSGNQQGLFWGRPKKDELFPICLEDSDESVSVNGILEAADKNIWVSTEGKGVYVLKDKKVIRHFEKELLDGNIHSMKIDEQDQVWISTRKGINKIEKGPRDYRVKKYTSYHGLPSDYVYDTYCYQDILYAATDEGLVKIDMNELDRLNFGMPPPVYIMNATVQSKSTLLKLNTDTIGEFSSQQNTISFEYTGISYKSNGNISFEYRLLPTINKWVATTNDNITFNNLPAGDYSFEVVAINAIGIRSAKPAVYRFRIEKHFTATIWFITLCIGLIIGLIGWAIYKYLKYEKLKLGEKSQNEKVIAELTLKSLQAQLNPHFIFNSLNAIQQFINVENRKEANEYLARFARLMRLYLGGSENQFISLEQEMEVIKLYCQLEHLRFSDRFRYEINMDDSIDLKNVEVPAMLLQPHVENAIRHGLIPCDSDNNLLQINIYSVNDGVICAIKDNGIGRSQSFINKQGKENRHKSLGNKISKERLDAIRSLHLAYITEEISDVIVDGEIRGTCVEIYIRKKD